MKTFTEIYSSLINETTIHSKDVYIKKLAPFFITVKDINGNLSSGLGGENITIPKGTYGRLSKNTIYKEGNKIIAMGATFKLDDNYVTLPLVKIDLDKDIKLLDKQPKGVKITAFGKIK